ncbi:hypothetical protein D5R81_18865 [Parashewanella spongiae]|uniref:Uncharacterized protein n=1 Tax=Parashewanella spongiae TaxID=342950 RepID=A0A3A6TDT3_9GAMM|nr:hypothetical protein [Parashewanella spongiae]MCL1080081.1 hypothetical protein [Parashewanella spongiae]RJY04940.1 hypothetical protein D5R81_18865 [Parashewanella spongiae]
MIETPCQCPFKVIFGQEELTDTLEEIDLPQGHDLQGQAFTGKRLERYLELKALAINLLTEKKLNNNEDELKQLLIYLRGLKKMVSVIQTVDEITLFHKKGLLLLTDHLDTYCQQEIPESLRGFNNIEKTFQLKFTSTHGDKVSIISSRSKCDAEIKLFFKVYIQGIAFAKINHLFTLHFAKELKNCFLILDKPFVEVNTRQGLLFSSLKQVNARMGRCFSITSCNAWAEHQRIFIQPSSKVINTYGSSALYLIESPTYECFKELLFYLRDNEIKCCILNIGQKFRELLLCYDCVSCIQLTITDYFQLIENHGVELLCFNMSSDEVTSYRNKISAKYIQN